MPRIYGYYRVSTAEQNPASQIQKLEEAGCDIILGDIGISGAKSSRPAFDQILDDIGDGDRLVVFRLDRMGRSLKHLIEVNDVLMKRGAKLESLSEKIDTSNSMGIFVFQVLGAVAQLEREIIRERTMAGLAVAASKGRFPGRPRKRDHTKKAA